MDAFRCARIEVGARSGDVKGEGVRGPGGLHENYAPKRDWAICKTAAQAAGAQIDRTEVLRTPVFLPADRRRAHRHLPHGAAGKPQRHLKGARRKRCYLFLFLNCISRITIKAT